MSDCHCQSDCQCLSGSLQVTDQFRRHLVSFSDLNRHWQLKLFGSFGCSVGTPEGSWYCIHLWLDSLADFIDASSARENDSDVISAEEKQNTEKETEAKKEHEQTNKRNTTNKLKQKSRTKQANKETTKTQEHKQTKKSKHKQLQNTKAKRFCKQSIDTKKEVAKQIQIAKEKHFKQKTVCERQDIWNQKGANTG